MEQQNKKPWQLWVEALRSGRYHQGKQHLESATGYCCLGVACMVAESNGVFVKRHLDGSIQGASLDNQVAVMSWLGLRDGHGGLTLPVTFYFRGNQERAKYLTTLNDSAAWDFNQIADLIESHVDELFVEEKR